MPYEKNVKGYVYILSNPDYKDDLYKIGMTTRKPEERAWELFREATGVPSPFIVKYERPVTNCHAAEDAIHVRLQNFRNNEYREFFKITFDDAKKILDDVCEEVEKLYSPEKILAETNIDSFARSDVDKPTSHLQEKHDTDTDIECPECGKKISPLVAKKAQITCSRCSTCFYFEDGL